MAEKSILDRNAGIKKSVCKGTLAFTSDLITRLRELSLLKQGWLDGVFGSPLKTSFIQWIADLFKKYYPSNIQLPYIYPTAEGGLSLEWDDDRYVEFSVDIDPETRVGSLYALKKTEEEIVATLQLQRDGWVVIEKLLAADVQEG